MEKERLTKKIIGAALKVHSALGPGLLERAYQTCLFRELEKQGLAVLSKVGLLINFNVSHLKDGITHRVN